MGVPILDLRHPAVLRMERQNDLRFRRMTDPGSIPSPTLRDIVAGIPDPPVRTPEMIMRRHLQMIQEENDRMARRFKIIEYPLKKPAEES